MSSSTIGLTTTNRALAALLVAGEVLHIECTVPGHHEQGMHMYLRAHDGEASAER